MKVLGATQEFLGFSGGDPDRLFLSSLVTPRVGPVNGVVGGKVPFVWNGPGIG